MLNPLDHPVCLDVPDRICLSAWHTHAPFAMYLVDVLRPSSFVELGTHYGFSYCAICQAIRALGLSTTCHAIDTWQGDDHAGSYGEEVFGELAEYHDPLYSSFSTLLRSTFDDALLQFGDQSIDLLHIDGLHTYEAVRHDFFSWLPKMSGRGIVLLHDTNVRERNFGVRRFWDEIRGRYPSFEFVHGHGLGVLAVGDEVPEGVRPFLGAEAQDAARIRRFFATLGGQARARYETKEARQGLREARERGDAADRLAANLEEAVAAKGAGLLVLEDRARELEEAVADRDARILGLEGHARGLEEAVADRDARLASASAMLDDLARRVDELTARLERADRDRAELVDLWAGRLADRDREARGLADRLADRDREARGLADRLADRDREARGLADRLADRDRAIADRDARLADRALEVRWLGSEVADRDARITELWAQADAWGRAIEELAARLGEVDSSLTWRSAQAIRRALLKVAPAGSLRWRGIRLSLRALRAWKRDGAIGLARRVVARPSPPAPAERVAAPVPLEAPSPDLLDATPTPPEAAPSPDPVLALPCPMPEAAQEKTEDLVEEPVELPEPVPPYEEWLRNNSWNEAARLEAEAELARLPRRPLLSVVMPVYNGDGHWLERAIESVQDQVYPDWELCIADDASTRPHVRRILRRFAASDDRLKVRFLERNGNISLASNAAAELAGGEYIVLLDQDDELSPDCLLEVARAIVEHDDPDIVYSDDDKVDVDGRRYDPQFKPDWSPELLLSYMYISHVFCIRRDRFEEVGGFRVGFEGCQDYDLALRLTDGPSRVAHIPKVLYHWRSLPSSTASTGLAKPEAFERGIRSVQEALDRRGIDGRVSRPDFAEQLHLGIFQADFPDDGPPVSILIPTKDRLPLVRQCVDSILSKTTYRNYEVVIIDNESEEAETLDYFARLPERCRVVRVSNEGGRFSYSRVNNEAVDRLGPDREFVLFLNNDTEVRRPEWLSQLVGFARIEGVGAVGARLLFPDGRVQHAGVLTTVCDGLPAHAFRLTPHWDNGYLSYSAVARNYSAVTAACLLMRRDLFRQLGGFDEQRFAVAYNDVDLCLRVRDAGHRVVYAPRAELTHHEGASRGFGDTPGEPLAYKRAWGLDRDPFYNPNLDRNSETFALRTRRAPGRLAAPRGPIRALMASHNLNHEGAPYFLHDLAIRLRDRGRIAPEVASPADGPLAESYRAHDIPVHLISDPLHHLDQPDGYSRGARGLGTWARSIGVDLVHANTLNGFPAVEAARSAGLPAIWTVHESAEFRTYFRQFGPDMTATALRAFSYPYRVLFVSDATRQMYLPLDARHNLETVHFGLTRGPIDRYMANHSKLDAASMIGVPAGKKVVTIVGTTCERKGQRHFVEAAAALLRGGRDDVTFYVVGCRPGPYLDGLAAIASEVPGAIHLVPETDQTFPYFRASDLFVCCSSNESYPRITLEAMAFGLPIVTTTVFGLAEQVVPNITALTFNPGDVPTLGHLIRTLLDDNDRRRTLAEAGRLRLELLPSFEEMVEAYERIYLEAVAAAAPPAANRPGFVRARVA
jgi:GT2 family glycosyltransferase/glycosyltransferase involved in cell wall biosynthesis